MGEVIQIPGKERSDRERLSEVRKMREKIVMGQIVDLKTYRNLKNIDRLLRDKIKIAEKSGSALPKEPA